MKGLMNRNHKAGMFGLAAVMSVATLGCSGAAGGLGTAEAPMIVEATIRIDGVPVQNSTIPKGMGNSTVFHVRMDDPQGAGNVEWVQMHYSVPGQGMHRDQGMVQLHDDGQGCDEMPGDGHYCYEDGGTHGGMHDGHHQGDGFGCHGSGSMTGEYRYEFRGGDREGHESNPVVHVVRVE